MKTERCLNLKPWQVRALLSGATQIRVPCKLATELAHNHKGVRVRRASDVAFTLIRAAMYTPCVRESFVLECPYPPGTVIVGREKWTFINMSGEHGEICIAYNADGDNLPNRPCIKVPDSEIARFWEYRRDVWRHRTRSSAAMPPWAARIRRTVLSCRPELACQISEEDARACGIAEVPDKKGVWDGGGPAMGNTPQIAYMRAWNAMYGSRYPRQSAWCWRIEVGNVGTTTEERS